jgi:hypothetical protein
MPAKTGNLQSLPASALMDNVAAAAHPDSRPAHQVNRNGRAKIKSSR